MPNLRFPEFKGEWERYKVSDLLDFYSTNSLSWEQLEYDTDQMFNLHYGLIHVGLPTSLNLNKEKLPNIKKEFHPKKYELCKEGDIAFADASEDTNDVAKAIEFTTLGNKQVVCGLHTIHGRDNHNITVVGFKGYAFSSPTFHNQIKKIAQGTKIYSISSKNFSECFIGIPSKEEQSKISRLFALIDERIETQNRIIEDLKQLRSAITNRIIYNLVADKKLVPFSEIYQMAGEGGTPNTNNRQYYEGGTIPFIKIDDLSSKYLTRNKDFITEIGLQKSSAWVIPANSLIYSNGATIGAVSINTYKVATKQGILGIVPKSTVCVEYLYYLTTSTFFKKQIHRIITHGTMTTAYLKDINKIKVPLPDIEKQNNVIKGLITLSEKIEKEQEILANFQAQKQYLLQQMFI